jgi:effector-binding domain-containing protein
LAQEPEIEAMTSIINKVIKINKEREIKEELFKKTIQELKKTFEQNDLDKLKDLYFDFATDKDESENLDVYESGAENIELVGE